MTKRFVDWKQKNTQQREAAIRRMRQRLEEKRLAKLFLSPATYEDDEYTLDVWELMNRSQSEFRW